MAKSAKTNDKMTSNNKKKPVLFEELVRTIYNELHYIKDEPEEIEDIHEPSNPKERLFSSGDFSAAFLTVDGKTVSESSANQMLNSRSRKSFGESTFYEKLKNAETRKGYLNNAVYFLKEQIDKAKKAVSYDVGKTMYSELKAIYSHGTQNSLQTVFSQIYIPEKNGYIRCIGEMLSNALMFHLLGDEKVSLVRKANLKKDTIAEFVGRNQELKDISQMLESNGLVIVSGEPGIGKTELMYKYAFDHKDEYRKIAFVDYNKSLMKSLKDIIAYNDITFRNNDVIRALSVKKDAGKSSLVIIENADKSAFDSKVLEQLEKAGFDVIIGSRYKADNSLEIGMMSDKDIKTLIQNQANNEPKKKELSDNLIKIINLTLGNTMYIILLTRALARSGDHIDAILKESQCLNKLYDTQKIEFKQRSIWKNEIRKNTISINQHLNLLYEEYSLPEDILKVLCFLSFMIPFPCTVAVNQIKKMLPEINDDMIWEMDKYHAIKVIKAYNQEDVLLFSYEILLYLCNCRTNQSAFDYSEEINEILTYIAGYNSFDISSNPTLLLNLECNFRFQDKESAIFRWQLLYFLEHYYKHDCPEHDCLVAIRNELEAQKQVQAIMDTSEKNHEIYFNLLLKYKDQKAYQELIENNFAEKVLYDSVLIKSWLIQADLNFSSTSEISNMLPDKDSPFSSNIIYNLINVIQSYTRVGDISKNVFGQPEVNNLEMLDALMSELRAGSLESTNMYSVMKQHISEDELKSLPSIFADLSLYKKVIYYSAVYYTSSLFYFTDIKNTDRLCALSEVMNILVRNYTIYSGDDRGALLYRLADMQLVSGLTDKAQETINEVTEFEKVVYNQIYILKSVNYKTRYLTRKYIIDKIADIQKNHAVSEDDLKRLFNEIMVKIIQDLTNKPSKDLIMDRRELTFAISVVTLNEQFQRENYIRGFIDSGEIYRELFPGSSTADLLYHNDEEMLEKANEKMNKVKEYIASQNSNNTLLTTQNPTNKPPENN